MSQDDPYSRSADEFVEPPRTFRQTLKHLGPGMILVGSVVGSGELIMTTKLGAVAGFVLLWFVLLSCFLKVVVQAEIARHTISSGRTFLDVFNALPGPSAVRPHWLTLRWMSLVMTACVIGVSVYVAIEESQRTSLVTVGLVVGIALACGVAAVAERAAVTRRYSGRTTQSPGRPVLNWFTWMWLASTLLVFVNAGAILGGAGQALELAFPNAFDTDGSRIWTLIIAAGSAAVLLTGSYGSLEKTLITLVGTFTFLTIFCTVALQWTDYAITPDDVGRGLTLALPADIDRDLLLVALAMFAGTGVAYGEMWTYTYWCVEKGYARNTGESQPGDAWPRRARGWIRVMYTDVLLTMVIYTVSTVCFYFLGAAVLFAEGLNPDGKETLSTLGRVYTGSIGNWAATLFVVGAFFVLLSTVLAGAAGSGRLLADALGVMGLIPRDDFPRRKKLIRVFIVVSLVLYSVAYWLFENPPKMLAITSSLIGAMMYPVVGFGVLWLRHRELDPRIAPGRWTTTWLWICAVTVAVISPLGIVIAMLI